MDHVPPQLILDPPKIGNKSIELVVGDTWLLIFDIYFFYIDQVYFNITMIE